MYLISIYFDETSEKRMSHFKDGWKNYVNMIELQNK